MVRYQLPTGKTVLLTVDQFLDLDDYKVQELIASNAGIEIEDPFIGFDGKEPEPGSPIPDVESYVEPLPEEEIIKIKKEINGDEGKDQD